MNIKPVIPNLAVKKNLNPDYQGKANPIKIVLHIRA